MKGLGKPQVTMVWGLQQYYGKTRWDWWTRENTLVVGVLEKVRKQISSIGEAKGEDGRANAVP